MTPSAFRHGLSEADFYELLTGRSLKIRSEQGLPDLYELLGRNFAGDYWHPVYRMREGGGAREEEIIQWVDTYDVVEHLQAGVSEIVEDHSDLDAWLKQALEKGDGAQLNIRIPPAMKAILTRFARERMMDVTTLARVWLVDGIRKELNKGSAARPRQDVSGIGE